MLKKITSLTIVLLSAAAVFAQISLRPRHRPPNLHDTGSRPSPSLKLKRRPRITRYFGRGLKRKSNKAPKPVYPAAARAEGAHGAVNVQVLIDEEGKVVSAVAIGGPATLREAAAEAARGATFAPVKLEGKPVKVSGIITYNFVS